VILDKGQIGSGETAHTTAHLSNVLDEKTGLFQQPRDFSPTDPRCW
jgi:hypothetical protein